MLKDYFPDEELRCSCCHQNLFNSETKKRLNILRHLVGEPLPISSGYRCEAYNKEIGATQTHATGQAVDIACSHKLSFKILKEAPQLGFTGIGINQKGGKRFIHLDDLEEADGRPRPHVWSY